MYNAPRMKRKMWEDHSMYEHIKTQDPEVYGAMMRELERQRDHLELIASENFVSPAVMHQ